MIRRFKTVFILLIVALVAALATSVGLTFAIWTSTGAGLDNNTVAPATDSPMDWNVWAKYFDGVVVNETTHEVAITSFHTDYYGLNLETLIIPTDIEVDGVPHKVVEVRSNVFTDATLKSLPVTIYVSPTVMQVCASAFSNLPNLTKVVFGASDTPCVLEDYSFAACLNLATIKTNGRVIQTSDGAAISGLSTAFFGCSQTITIE